MIDPAKLAAATKDNTDAYAAGLDLERHEAGIRNRIAALRWELDAVAGQLDAGGSTEGLTDSLSETGLLLGALGRRRDCRNRLERFGVNPADILADPETPTDVTAPV
jgi:hypothetical protein